MAEPARKISYQFVATPTEIHDKLVTFNLSPTQYKIVMWILRQTYGWHKPMVERDLTRIADALGIDKTAACRAIRALIADGVVLQDGRGIAVNPDVDAWGAGIEEATDAPAADQGAVDNSINNPTPQPYIKEKKKNNRAASSHESFFKKLKSRFASKKPVVKGEVLDRIPEADRASCAGIVNRYAKRRGIEYVERAIEYVLFRNPKKFASYLACCLREGWGEDWHKQRQEAAKMDAERIEAAKARAEAVEAENKRIEAENQAFEERRERVFGMAPDELATMERDFVGGLSGIRLKRYRKRGLSAVENDFVEYCESMKKSIDK